jgi:hypothetical protein
MMMSLRVIEGGLATAELTKLQRKVALGKDQDERARRTDAATHLRKAIELLEGCIETTPATTRIAELLVEAADLLVSEEP